MKATTENETLILNYLTLNASEQLKEKINSGKKTLSQCWNYIVSEARKLEKNGCACLKSETVFGWAVHFFEEDSIEGTQSPKNTSVKTVAASLPKVKKVKHEEKNEQLSLFDMLG